MIFYSVPFLILFVLSTALLHFSKNIKQQHLVILLTNLIFYGYWDVRFLLLLIFEIAVCYFMMLVYSKTKRRIFVTVAVVFCIAVLGVFKYCNFFLDTFTNVFGIKDTISLNLIIPLGVSFYTFQALSYVFDVYRGVINVETNFVKLTAYLSFFPQITSGPIVKARMFLPQLDILHKIKKENVYSGIQLFLLGLTKKVVFADRIGVAVDAVFSAPQAYNGISIFFAVLGYAMQIYCDFSGYSDMAIGIARIWGFDLGKNFNMPYLAKNPSDFWGRWHISLSSWFKEYVYIPLGGSRDGKWKTYRNLFITMLLSGIWHGANWTFVIWGVFHAIYSVVHKMWKSSHRHISKKSQPVLCTFANFSIICLSWVVFRANNIGTAFDVLKGLFNFEGVSYINVYVVVFLVLIVLSNIYSYKKNNGNATETFLNLDNFKSKLIFVIWICLIAMFAYVGDSAFIYAQF
jgi:alginate O-acetyltransferase complex protein AlgI